MDRRKFIVSSAVATTGMAFPVVAQTGIVPPIRILSIDGGGIRGIAAARMLRYIDAALRASGKPGIASAFDLYIGTSTGCILAAGLASSQQLGNRFDSPDAIEAIYRQRGAEIFTHFNNAEPSQFRPKYRSDALGAVLKDVFGGLTAAQLQRNLIGTYFNMKGDHQAVIARCGPIFDQSTISPLTVAEINWASASAPTYFDPARINPDTMAVDGGLFANNPAAIAVVEARRWFGDRPMLVVSIGCGANKPRYQSHNTWGIMEWADPTSGVPILDAVMRGQSECVDNLLSTFLNTGTTTLYYRFQFSMDNLPANRGRMDDVSSANLDALTALAVQEMETPTRRQQVATLASLF